MLFESGNIYGQIILKKYALAVFYMMTERQWKFTFLCHK